jgi:hypothetical protein
MKTPADVRSATLITMKTTVCPGAIDYEVVVLGDFGDGPDDERIVWQRTEHLYFTEAHRAGGYHVTESAREQERVAMAIAEKLR